MVKDGEKLVAAIVEGEDSVEFHEVTRIIVPTLKVIRTMNENQLQRSVGHHREVAGGGNGMSVTN